MCVSTAAKLVEFTVGRRRVELGREFEPHFEPLLETAVVKVLGPTALWQPNVFKRVGACVVTAIITLLDFQLRLLPAGTNTALAGSTSLVVLPSV